MTESPRNSSTNLGLYVHLPFCRRRCSYCAFAISTDIALATAYVKALGREIATRLPSGETIESIYLGGGTPSLSEASGVKGILDELRSRAIQIETCEITLEANPEDMNGESLRRWFGLGINRLSIGIQSTNDLELRPIGRIHGREGSLAALELSKSWPGRASADLIVGLPSQTAASFRESLDRVMEHEVGHISIYMLDLEEKSPLEMRVNDGRTRLPEDSLTTDLYLEACDVLSAAGYEQYEISNFAREGERSRHNLRYWERREYYGFGLGAHSFVGESRFANTRDIHEYIEKWSRGEPAIDFQERLGEDDIRHERILLGLRQSRGIPVDEFESLTGLRGKRWREVGMNERWIEDDEDRVRLTTRGFVFSNEYISRLF